MFYFEFLNIFPQFAHFVMVIGFLGSWIGFLGLGFSVDGVWGLCRWGFLGFMGFGLSIHV